MNFRVKVMSCLITLPLIYACSLIASNDMFINLNGHIFTVLDSTISQIQFPTLSKELIHEKDFKHTFDSFDVSPSTNNIVIANNPLNGDEELFLLAPNGDLLDSLIQKRFIRNPAFSPNGRLIAFLSSGEIIDNYIPDWHVYILDISSGEVKKVSNIPVLSYAPSWNTNSEQILVTSKDRSIYSINVISGNQNKIIEYGLAPTVSNSGLYIAYLTSFIDNNQKLLLKEYVNMTKNDYLAAQNNRDKADNIRKIEALQLNNHIAIYNTQNSNSKIITESLSVEDRVLWSPDDRYLIYNDESRLNRDIYVMNIETGIKKIVNSINGKVMVWHKEIKNYQNH